MSLLFGGVVAFAGPGTPEIDNANANITLHGTYPIHTQCIGEDQTTNHYQTYAAGGNWVGTETQSAGDTTEHGLNGNLTLSGIKWTIRANGRGVLTGAISLATSASGTIYSGVLILVSQGFPTSPPAPPNVYARGWIRAHLSQPDETETTGDDSLIANVEFKLGLTMMTGMFGTVPGSNATANYAVTTNLAPTAADGTC
jgi:hypothetical protein